MGHVFVIQWCVATACRAEEEAANRARLEREKRELQNQLQEALDDLDSEKDAKTKIEKQRRTIADVRTRCHSICTKG